jgi:two-component SAPR family response regulator
MADYNLAIRVSQARPETKIVLMSGYDENATQAMDQSWRFIRKPYQLSKLLKTVDEILSEPPPE